MMALITDKLRQAKVHEWDSNEKKAGLFSWLEKLIKNENLPPRLCQLFSLFMCSYKVDVLWLDEGAEALRNCALAFDSYLLMKQNMLGSERRTLSKCPESITLDSLIEELQR